MTTFLEKLDKERIPTSVAIIMDGNGRWAKKQGKNRIFGHQNGVDSVDQVMEGAAAIGIKYLTLYAFSTENWNRPADEVNALMDLFVTAINSYLEKMLQYADGYRQNCGLHWYDACFGYQLFFALGNCPRGA